VLAAPESTCFSAGGSTTITITVAEHHEPIPPRASRRAAVSPASTPTAHRKADDAAELRRDAERFTAADAVRTEARVANTRNTAKERHDRHAAERQTARRRERSPSRPVQVDR